MIIGWRPEEIDLLTRMYPKATWDELRDAFPRRSKRALMSMSSSLRLKRAFFKKNGVSEEMFSMASRRIDARIGLPRFEEVMGFTRLRIRAWELGKKPPSRFEFQCYKDTLERFGV